MIPIYPDMEPNMIPPDENGRYHVDLTLPAYPPENIVIAATEPFIFHYRVAQLFFWHLEYRQYLWLNDVPGGLYEQWIIFPGYSQQWRIQNAQYINQNYATPSPPETQWDLSFSDPAHPKGWTDEIILTYTNPPDKEFIVHGENEIEFENPLIEGNTIAASCWGTPYGSDIYSDLRCEPWLVLGQWRTKKAISVLPMVAALLVMGSCLVSWIAPMRIRRS